MAQIHALTPEGRLPTAAVQHVEEIAIPYDSGVIDVTASVPTITAGTFSVRRVGKQCRGSATAVQFSDTGTFTLPGMIPPGFRPDDTFDGFAVQLSGQDGYRVIITKAGNFSLYDYGGGWVRFYFTWLTDDPLPA